MSEQQTISLRVERYTFAIDETLTLDKPRTFERKFPLREAFEKDGIKRFRLQRPCTNVHVPGFIYLTTVAFSDGGPKKPVNLIGGEPLDAWNWNAESVGTFMDCKDIGPEHIVIIKGYLTQLVPAPFWSGYEFKFMLSMTGPINEAR